jgi:hypothetical protein
MICEMPSRLKRSKQALSCPAHIVLLIPRIQHTEVAKKRDGFAFWRTRSRGIKDGQECGGGKNCEGGFEGCGELITARNCLRMPLRLDSTGVSAPHTVQYRSRLPAAFKPSVCMYSAASRLDLVRTSSSRETREKGPVRVLLLLVDVAWPLQRADWRRSIENIHAHDAVLG